VHQDDGDRVIMPQGATSGSLLWFNPVERFRQEVPKWGRTQHRTGSRDTLALLADGLTLVQRAEDLTRFESQSDLYYQELVSRSGEGHPHLSPIFY
jgi:hypothetical protein